MIIGFCNLCSQLILEHGDGSRTHELELEAAPAGPLVIISSSTRVNTDLKVGLFIIQLEDELVGTIASCNPVVSLITVVYSITCDLY